MRIKIVNRKKMWSPFKHSSWRGRRFISIFLTGRSIKNGKIIIGNIENLNLHWTDVHFRMISPRKLEGFTWSQLIYELSLKEYHRWRFLPSKRLKVQKTNMKKIYSKAPPALHCQSFFVPWIKRSCLHFVADHWVLNWECYRIVKNTTGQCFQLKISKETFG